jgi:DNA-binding response OmpR family regulator
MRILIVEDNDDLRNFMQYPLSEQFDVLVAEDGVKAWEIIQQQMPDLVISDVMMPNMDGFELCELIKSTYETSHIPVVLLTALSDKAEQLHGLGLGADDYLTKPFDMTLLIHRIKSIIQNRVAVRERAMIRPTVNRSEPILQNKLNDKFVKMALEVVHANMANSNFDKDAFAYQMNVSSSLLYKKLKALTDLSPVDFIKDIRLNYALELLQKKSYTVTEVSELSGFSSVGYFSTVFKKHFGKSPTEIED